MHLPKKLQATSYKLSGGFTMIELMVAISLFTIIIGLATGSFVQAIRSQRVVVASSSAISNVSQILEQMAREVRTGNSFDGTNSTKLDFTNYKGEKIVYQYSNNAIERCVDNPPCIPITAKDVNINSFNLAHQGITTGDKQPAKITIAINVEGFSERQITIQTSVSSRSSE